MPLLGHTIKAEQWRSQTFAIARAQLGHQLMWYMHAIAHTLTHQQPGWCKKYQLN